jgi:tape measure domain-containing protein
MGADITTLGLAVDSSQVTRAKHELGGFTTAGNKAADSATKLEGGMSRLKGVLAGLALGATAVNLIKMADAMSLMDARLKLATGSGVDFAKAQADIYRIAQQSNVGLAETASLYTKLHEPVKRLGGGVNETSKIVEAFSASLRVGGASAQEAASATLQFGQAMGSGKLQGDEFRAIAEASPRFMKAMAEGMGVPIETLKKLGTEGKLTADIIGNALPKSLEQLRAEMKLLPDTVGGAMTRLANDFKIAVNDLNKSSGTTLGLAGGIDAARALIPTLKSELEGVFESVGSWLNYNKVAIGEIWTGVKSIVGDLWEMVKAGGAVVGFLTESTTQSGFLKNALVSARMLIAGFQDGVELIGGAFATVGSLIMKAVVYPLTWAMDLTAKLVGLYDKDMADNLRSAAAHARELAGAGAAYGDSVVAKFQAGDTAVMRLSKSLAEGATSTVKAAAAATAADAPFKTLKGQVAELSKEGEAAKKAYDDLTKSITVRIREMQAEATSGKQLNEAEKAAIKYKVDLTDKYKLWSASQREAVEALLKEWDALIKTAEATEALSKTIADVAKHSSDMDAAQHSVTDALRGTVVQLLDENERLRLGEVAYAARQRAVLLATAVEKEWQAAMEGGNWALEEQASLLREQARLMGDNVMLQGAKDAADEWQRTADIIADSLSDAFIRGLGAGKSLFVSLRDWVSGWLTQLGKVQLQGSLSTVISGNSSTSNLNKASLASSLYNSGGMYGTAAAGGNYAAVYSGQAYGTGFASQQSAMLAAQEGGMVSQAGASSMSGWASTAGWVAAIAAGVWKANQDYKQGFGRDSAKDFSDEIGGGGRYIIGSGGLESELANALSKIGFSDRMADALSGSLAVSALFGYSKAQIQNAGITGSVTGGDFSGSATADAVQKAGFVRKLFGGDDKVTTLSSALPEELGRFLDAGAAGILDKAKAYGTALGLPVEQLSAMSHAISVKADEEGAITEQALLEALAGYGDALVAGYADAIKPLAMYGETAVQTFERVGNALLGVNEVLGVLGVTALSSSVAGAGAAVALTELFGGLDNLRSSASAYFENFFTESEKAALLTKGLTATFEDLGMSLPKTRDEFRAIMEAQDPLTEKGQRTVATLLGVQGAFAELVPAVEAAEVVLRSAADILSERLGLERRLLELQGDTVELRARELALLDPSNRDLQNQIWAMEDLAGAMQDATKAAQATAQATAAAAAGWARMSDDIEGGVRSAYQNVVSAITAARAGVESAAQDQLDALRKQSDGVTSVFEKVSDALGSFIKDVRSQITGLEGTLAGDGGRALAEVAIQEALSEAKKGKGLNMDAIKGALGTFTKVDINKYTSAVDYKREVSRTANMLREVNGAADAELRRARNKMDVQLTAITRDMDLVAGTRDAELATLDSQLAAATDAVSQLISIDKGVTGVADAISKLGTALGALASSRGDISGAAKEQWTKVGNTDVWTSAGGAVGMRASGDLSGASMLVKGTNGLIGKGSDIVDWVRGRLQAGDQMSIYNKAKEVGISLASLDAMMGAPVGTSPEWAKAMGLPVFAAGGMHAGGVRLVGEYGPEVEATGPARYYSASDTMSMLTSPQGNAEALAGAVRELQSEVAGLRVENRALLTGLIKHDMKSADILQRWDGAGMPPVRT